MTDSPPAPDALSCDGVGGPQWVELCCGSAAVTLRLLGGPHAEPPIPYPGGKRKFAGAILGALGLRAGLGAESVTLCDAGPWADVWRHLSEGDDLTAHMTAWNDLDDDEQDAFWPQLYAALPTMPNPAAASAWLWLSRRSFSCKGPAAGHAARRIKGCTMSNHGDWRHTIDAPAPKIRQLAGVPWPSTRSLRCDVREIPPFGGAIVYIDPPYLGTTRYADNIGRAEVLELAKAWQEAGSVVAVSERGPLPLEGWHHVEITSARTGTPRNWSLQQREWLTMSVEPAHRPAEQMRLLGATND